MSVFRNDELTTYDVLVDNVIGMPLLPGDLVQTDDDTFVEMQVMPSRTIVKIAENTTFEIENIGGNGGGSFNMSYGRLRARVERITQDDRFEIRGFSAVAGVRGTDFGYDMVVQRAAKNELDVAELKTKVYVFDGEVEVTEREDVSRPERSQPVKKQSITLQANEMVNVVSAAPEGLGAPLDELVKPDSPDGETPSSPTPEVTQGVVFQQEMIETEIQEFWTRRDFQEEAVDPDRVEERFPGINARVRQLSEERRQYQELQRLRREGLLGSPQELLAQAGEVVLDDEPERVPQAVSLNAPGGNERIERILLPQDSAGEARQLRLAGHWMVGLGMVMEIAGLAGAWYVDDVRSVQDLGYAGPSTGAIIGGGVFITSGLLSYLFGLFATE